MPCRPKLCQRLAAQLSHPTPALPGSNHIWISDELLSEAFNRYVRVSHTARRYGSNVPGPLEARRRASKRRMGMAVTGGAMGPPGVDFGALFGAGAGAGQGSMENGWNWKAPVMRQPDPPVSSKESSNLWNWKPTEPVKQIKEWEQFLEIPKNGLELVEASRLAFSDLLEDCEKLEKLDKADLAGICDFLTSSADETVARNTTKLVEWLLGRSVSSSAWQAITALICDKIQLASLPNPELIKIIKALPKAFDWQQDENACQQLRDIYTQFSASLHARNARRFAPFQAIFEESCEITQSAQACSDLIDRLNTTIKLTDCVNTLSSNISWTLFAISRHGGEDEIGTELLSRLASAFDEVPTEIVTEVLGLSTRFIVDKRRAGGFVRVHALKWLQCISAHESLGRSSLHMKTVYAELAKTLRPTQMVEHFTSLLVKPLDIQRFLLNTWLPNTDLEKLESRHCEGGNASSGRKELKPLQFGLRGLSVKELPIVTDEFERLIARGEKYLWTVFLRAFARTGFSYEAITYEVLDLCRAKYAPLPLYRIFYSMVNNCELALPTAAAVSLIKHFVAAKRPDLALTLFQDVPSVAITDVPELPSAILEHSETTKGIFEVLLRQPEIIPMERRDLQKLVVTPQHIDIVHLVAYDIASSTALRPAQAYRGAWACYRWLQDRGAPLKPLISRAIVEAGLLRKIKARIWVPDARLDYILSIVEKVEGPEVRIKVDMLANHMRSAVHAGVLSNRRAKEQAAWMKSLRMSVAEARYRVKNEGQFRVKRWTKAKPLLTKDETSYWVPNNDFGTSPPLSSRGDDAGLSSDVDDWPQRVPTGGVAMSEDVDKHEQWWRPNMEPDTYCPEEVS